MTRIYWLSEKAGFFVERRNGMTQNHLSSNCTDTLISLFPSAKRVKGRFGFSSAMSMLFIVLMVFIMTGCGSSSSSTPSSLPPLTDALWIGFQDGETGDWEEIELPDNKVLDIAELSPTDGKYGLAVVLASEEDQSVTSITILTTVNELPAIDFNGISSGVERATLQVEVQEPSDFPGGSYVRLNLLGDYAGISPGSFPYTRSFDREPGTYDLIVTRADSYDDTPTHLEEHRDLTLTDGTTLEETIASDEFNVSNALTGPYAITVLNEDSSTMDRSLYDGEVTLLTANNTEAELGEKEMTDSTDLSYAALGSLHTNDIYILHIYIEPDDNSVISYFEGFDTAEDKNVTPPSAPFVGTFAATTVSGNLLPGLTGTAYANAIGYTTQFDGTADEIDYRASGHVSFERTDVDISFVTPDLSSAPGWNARWSIPDTATMEVTAVSVQVSETGANLEDFANWYLGETVRLEDGEWLASIANIVYGDSGGGSL
jgi:hypothetical protein